MTQPSMSIYLQPCVLFMFKSMALIVHLQWGWLYYTVGCIYSFTCEITVVVCLYTEIPNSVWYMVLISSVSSIGKALCSLVEAAIME